MEVNSLNDAGGVSDVDVLNAIPSGHVCDVRLLNLLSARTADDLAGIQSLVDVNLVLIPEPFVGALSKVRMEDVNAVVPIPIDGQNVFLSGDTKLTGEALAAGDAETRLIVVGQATITTPVTSVGYEELYMIGQLFAPRGSEATLTAVTKNFVGQVLYYPPGARFMTNSESIGADYLRYLPHPVPHVVMGHLVFEDDVTPELLMEKIPEIMLCGLLEAPRALVPAVQVLTLEKHGEIRAIG